ncbi:MAG: ATP-binding cassette domain-containing protein [Muribaculaceae bacterium]|nr:ATP-binding cassette domain-containing protein [Muribaculaceae bacterium]
MDSILSIKGVSKDFTGHKRALDNVSFDIPRGSVYGILGPNGAGKTTLLRIINHITAPDTGIVEFNGHQLTAKDTLSIGYLPEERGLYKKMRVGEQALYFARLRGMSKADATKALQQWFERFDITDWWGKKVEELSKGMAQKVQFIVTVIHKPKLLIFDEPFSGFDPINANLLKEEILKQRDEGATVIFSTHNMASVEEVCDHITLINQGRNVLSGNVDTIRRDYFSDTYDFIVDPATTQNALSALTPFSKEISQTALPNGDNRLSLRLNPGTQLNEVIAAANNAAALHGFSPTLATMNEIFIRTVDSTKTATNE